ncbi:MAG: hypothetical protein HWN68_01695 [Desulfobacterales bacterium]|nr:hypothetical protein [Desulfobacterales bacterium]
MIFKKLISISATVLFITAVIAALFFAPFLKQHYPGFSTVLFISSVIFFAGIGYAIIERNMAIGILTIFVTMLIPFIKTMLANYWEWVLYQFHAFFG